LAQLPTRQRQTYLFLTLFQEANGHGPGLRKIGEFFGSGVATVQGHLRRLEKKGFINTVPYYPCSTKLVSRVQYHFETGNGTRPKNSLRQQMDVLACDDDWGAKLNILRREIAGAIAKSLDEASELKRGEIVMVLDYYREHFRQAGNGAPERERTNDHASR